MNPYKDIKAEKGRFENLEETFKEGQEWSEEIINYFDENYKAQMEALLHLINLAYELGRNEAGRPLKNGRDWKVI